MNDASVQYNLIFPLAKKATYLGNDTVDFILSLENKKLVPGSVALSGNVVLQDGTNLIGNENIQIDSDAGYHSLFRDFVSEFRNVGVTENFQYYPRYVKMKTQATKYRQSLGTETYNCIEGKCPTLTVRQGYDKGTLFPQAGATPFVIKPDIAVNKSNQPIPGNQVGTVRIRARLAPNNEVLFGTDVNNDSNYFITDLKLHYETVPDDNTRPPLAMEVYQVNRQVIETNNANLATFVPSLSDAVHISFHEVSLENTLNENFLRCVPLPGQLLANNPGGLFFTDPRQGAERVYYAINDTDTALVGFTMETRTEMEWNYLRSFNNEPNQYSITDSRLNGPVSDGYGLGINFGGPIDFTKQKFAVEINSQVSTPYSSYLYFRGLVQVA